jgi:hypothetical protein
MPSDNSWLGFPTREYLRASEAVENLNLPPEQMFLPPEQIQAARLDWSYQDAPDHTWSVVDEDDFPTDLWYIQREPAVFYWDLTEGFAGFYGLEIAPDFYWTVSPEGELVFYPEAQSEPSLISWGGFYLSPDRFYVVPEPPQFYWNISVEPI